MSVTVIQRPDVQSNIPFPDVTVEFSPFTDPLQVPEWVDITPYLRSFQITRGRSDELSRMEAGTATFVMDNHLGQFDPTNSTGPYFGGIRPMRQVRIQAWTPLLEEPFYVGDSFVGGEDVLGATLFPIGLFSGFVESWEQDWDPQPAPNPDSVMTIHAVDAFLVLGKIMGIPVNSGLFYSGFFVQAVIDYWWPLAVTNIQNGLNAINWTAVFQNVLSTIQEVDASEGGLFFAARDGSITFYDRLHVIQHPPTTAQTWGDHADERQYQNINVELDESAVLNNVLVLLYDGSGGGAANDQTSIHRYVERRQDINTMLYNSWDAAQRAIDIIARQSSPYLKITSLEVGVRDDIEWVDVLSKDMLDRIIVKRRPLHTEPGIVQDSTIQRITISSSSRWAWSIVWNLTATPKQNVLTAEQAGFHTPASLTGWAVVSNCTFSHIVGNSYDFGFGFATSGHMRLTNISTGPMIARTNPTNQLAVTPGHLYTAGAYFQQEGGGGFGANCHVEIQWLDSGLGAISIATGNTLNDGFTNYVNSAVTAVAPPTAAFASLRVVVENTSVVGERHAVDAAMFLEGEQTGYTPGSG